MQKQNVSAEEKEWSVEIVVYCIIIAAIASILSSLWQILLSFMTLRKARRDQHSEKPMSSFVVASRRSVVLGMVNFVLTICLLGFLLYFFQLNGTFSQTQRGVASTPATPQGIYTQATSAKPVFDDSLSQNSANNWNVSSDKANLTCGFTAGAYFSSTHQNNPEALCVDHSTNFSNYAYQSLLMFTKTAS